MSHCESLCTEFETTCTCFITSSGLKNWESDYEDGFKKGRTVHWNSISTMTVIFIVTASLHSIEIQWMQGGKRLVTINRDKGMGTPSLDWWSVLPPQQTLGGNNAALPTKWIQKIQTLMEQKQTLNYSVNISNEHGTQEKMFLTVFQEPLAFVLQITKATRLSKAHRTSSKINT